MTSYHKAIMIAIILLGGIILGITGCVHQPEAICQRAGLDVAVVIIHSQSDEKGHLDKTAIKCVKRSFK